MGRQPTMHFEWNYSSSVIIKRKGFGKALNLQMAKICQANMYDYIPYQKGGLANKVRITANDERGMITYLSRYAKPQYEREDYVHANATQQHPLATCYWDKAAWTTQKQSITQQVNEYRKGIAE